MRRAPQERGASSARRDRARPPPRLTPRVVLAVAGLAGALLITACGSDPTGSESEERPAAPVFVLTVEAPGQVRVDETLAIRLLVTNAGSPGNFDYQGYASGEPAHDVTILDAAGRVVWSRQSSPPAITLRSLWRLFGADESLALDSDWDLRDVAGVRVSPGQYRVNGLVRRNVAAGGNLHAHESVTVTVVP